jgi:hypothetical protein
MALEWLWSGFGVALGWLWGRNRLAINRLWDGFEVALGGFADAHPHREWPECGNPSQMHFPRSINRLA